MEIAFWAATDVGRVREHNEDNFLVDKRLRLFIVCDGMGGHAAGEVASAMSVRIVREVVSSQRELIEQINEDPYNVELGQSLLRALEFAVQEANRRVFESSRDDEKRRGMGTTCCVLLLTNKKAYLAHVGDSRIYLMRQQQVHQLTEDHSLYNEMVRLGKIRAGDPINLPNKNAVTRAVGVREIVEVDGLEFEIFEQDRFLICSDGLCGYFKADEQIKMMLSAGDVKDVTELSIAFAIESGGKDNVTAIVVDVVKQDATTQQELLESTLEGIKHVPYFQYLTQKEKTQVLGLAQTHSVDVDANIFSLADQDSQLCIVLDGQIELRRDGRVLEVLEAGGYTGEVGFIDGQPNDFDAIAIAPSEVLAFSRRQFMELLRQSPELAVKLMWNFLQMFTINIRELGDMVMALSVAAEEAELASQQAAAQYAAQQKPQEVPVPSLSLPQIGVREDLTMPPSDLNLAAPSESTVQVPTQEEAPQVVIPGDGGALNETTEAPRTPAQAFLDPPKEADLFPEEDLRATVQLEWGSNGELLESKVSELDEELAQKNDQSQGPPPLPAFGAKMPPLPPRKPRNVQPMGKGISGESNTNTVEIQAIDRQDIQPVVAVEEETQTSIKAKLPPMAAVMKRTKRRSTEQIKFDDKPLMTHGLHSSSEGVVDRSDLVTTVQLDLNELDFEDIGDEPPTKQLERPSFEAFAELTKKEPNTPSSPSPKVQVNFGDESEW